MMARRKKTYTASCRREDGWWIVTVPEIAGVFTHAKRLEQVEGLARDAIALWLEVPPDGFDVLVAPDVPGDAADAVNDAQVARRAAAEAQELAAKTTTAAVVALSSSGIPYRDVGKLVGISHQRVAQILEEAAVKS